MGDESSLPFTDPLYERQEPALERQIQHADHWTPGRRHRTRPRVSCLLNGPDPGPSPEPVRRRPQPTERDGAPLERVCGISRGPGCCTLLLYLPESMGS